MSRNVLKVFPLEFGRHFTNSELTTVRHYLLSEYCDSIVADSWKVENFDDIRFIDCGSGLKRISCPLCGRKIELIEWQDLMKVACSTDGSYSPELRLTLECGHQMPLHALTYRRKCAFASAVASVEVVSHVMMGWINELPWLGFVEASYGNPVSPSAATMDVTAGER